jgi:hypothetical protein
MFRSRRIVVERTSQPPGRGVRAVPLHDNAGNALLLAIHYGVRDA